jgi:hypothetical protein
MIPRFIIYVEPENIEDRSKIVVRLIGEGFEPMISVATPSKSQLEGMVGIVFDQNFRGEQQKDFRGKPSAIVWYNNDMTDHDIQKLIPYFEAKLLDKPFTFSREDSILEEFTKANRDTFEVIEPEGKKIKA